MKRRFALVGFVLVAMVLQAWAQSLEEQYVRIYNLIQQADGLAGAGDRAPALARYVEAQTALKKLQQLNPGWNEKVVKFRLSYLETKIGEMTAKSPATAQPVTPGETAAKASAPAEVQRELNALHEALRRLQAEKTVLEAKLKEAFATQPAAIDPRELAKAEGKIESLMKENDLLKAALAQEKSKISEGTDPKTLEQARQALAEANRKLADQTERVDTLSVEKTALLARLDALNSNPQNAPPPDATRTTLDEANRKLALENATLESRVRELAADAGAAEALRAENQLLKRQLADAKTAAPVGKPDETARQLQQTQAQLAALQSDAEILRLEKIALQNRMKQMSAAPVTTAVIPADGRPADVERIKQLEQQREDLRVKLEAANKELYGRDSRKVAARMDELSNEIATLRARLQVFEARNVPYTAEELAMMKQPAPRIGPADAIAGKASARELPAGTAALAAEAQRLFSARNFEKAEEKYAEMLRQDEKNVYTLANLAAIQLELNRLDEAEKNILQALAVSPEDGFSLSILGYVKFRQGKYDEALDALSRAAKLNPDSAEIQNYLGVTLSHKGLRGPAETALRKAITLNPNYGSAHNNLAVIYLSQKPPFTDLARWHYQKSRAAGHPPNDELEKLLDSKVAKPAAPPPGEVK